MLLATCYLYEQINLMINFLLSILSIKHSLHHLNSEEEQDLEMMSISLYQNTFTSPFQIKSQEPNHPLLPKSLLPCFERVLRRSYTTSTRNGKVSSYTPSHASMIETPVLWFGRVCIYYALLKAGLAGSPESPLISADLQTGGDDLGFAKWFEGLQGKSGEKEATYRRKLVSKWHTTTKGTLKRSYRVPSKAVGQRLLKGIASLLSDDDHFIDATSHKGCRIRRESAHGESVCCNNVRALFDELPTPHMVVEITPFPAGPLTEKDYAKAEKLEKVLRSGASI